MKNLPLILLVSMLPSCTQVKTKTNDHFDKVRHGIMPLEATAEGKAKMDKASVARGEALYKQNCFSCHGEKGAGDGPAAAELSTPPTDLGKVAREVRNFKFFMSISQYQGDMPGWKHQFKEADRDDLVAYIKTFR